MHIKPRGNISAGLFILIWLKRNRKTHVIYKIRRKPHKHRAFTLEVFQIFVLLDGVRMVFRPGQLEADRDPDRVGLPALAGQFKDRAVSIRETHSHNKKSFQGIENKALKGYNKSCINIIPFQGNNEPGPAMLQHGGIFYFFCRNHLRFFIISINFS